MRSFESLKNIFTNIESIWNSKNINSFIDKYRVEISIYIYIFITIGYRIHVLKLSILVLRPLSSSQQLSSCRYTLYYVFIDDNNLWDIATLVNPLVILSYGTDNNSNITTLFKGPVKRVRYFSAAVDNKT